MKPKDMLIVFASWILTGCASSNLTNDFSLSPDSKSGLLIGSVKFHGALSSYRVYFKGLSNNEKGGFEAGGNDAFVSYFTGSGRSDFPDQEGKLRITLLPPGEYEINSWGVQSGVAHLSQTQPFSIKFIIEPGKATYIGSFLFTVTNKMAATVTGVKVDFVDAFEEDAKVLRQMYPNLARNDIYRGVEPGLKKENVGGASSVYFDLAPLLLQVRGVR